MKKLFNEFDVCNNDGDAFFISASEVIKKLMRAGERKGYSTRDMETILIEHVTSLGVVARLDQGVQRHKKKNKTNKKLMTKS